MSQEARYDKATTDWFIKNPDAETTVMECSYCGLFYKPSLGHRCKVKRTVKCHKCQLELLPFTYAVKKENNIYCEQCFFEDAIKALNAKPVKVNYEGTDIEEE